MANSWRPARSLVQLEDELEAQYPGTTVWMIGDEDHQDSWSDHNPNVCCDIVCAADILGDGGMDLQDFVDYLIAKPHPNLRYVIYNRKIYQRKNGFAEQDYDGVNAHKSHAHVSVGNGPDGRSTTGYDNTKKWGVANVGNVAHPVTPKQPSTGEGLAANMPTTRRGNKGRKVRILQALLGAWGWRVAVDGIFGPQTERAVKAFQGKYAKPIDGIVGPITWAALLDQ